MYWTEYWKSQERKFCEFCQCWIADNKPSVQSHENGKRHKENVAKKLAAMSKKSVQQHKESLAIDRDMKKMEEAAMKAYLNDMKANPDFTSQQIIKTLEEKGELHRLDEIEKKSADERLKADSSKSKHLKKKSGGAKPEEEVAASNLKTKWVATESDGNTYYWNFETNETTWEVPSGGFITMADYTVELATQKVKAKEKKEEVRAFKAREDMKKLRPKGEGSAARQSSELSTASVGPAPRLDPYGGWTTIVKEEPVKVDLQLPKTEEVPIFVPAVRESRVGMKEKKLESLDDVDDVPTTFKKRKLGFRGNIRRRGGDDSD